MADTVILGTAVAAIQLPASMLVRVAHAQSVTMVSSLLPPSPMASQIVSLWVADEHIISGISRSIVAIADLMVDQRPVTPPKRFISRGATALPPMLQSP